MCRRLESLACETDLTAVKFILAVGGYIVGAGFLFDRACVYVACRYIDQAAPWWVWGCVWLLYGHLALWRTFDAKHRYTISLLVNSLGVFMYGALAVGSVVARWPHWPLSSGGVTLTFAAFWVLARTAVNPGRGFRGD